MNSEEITQVKKQYPISEIEMEVRDYELDLQGIVNNSIYLNYFEHARHGYMRNFGLNFHTLHEEGWDPVVVRIEVDYRMSLTAQDTFKVRTTILEARKLRITFYQEIIRSKDGVVCAEAKVLATTLFKGRPKVCPQILDALEGKNLVQ